MTPEQIAEIERRLGEAKRAHERLIMRASEHADDWHHDFLSPEDVSITLSQNDMKRLIAAYRTLDRSMIEATLAVNALLGNPAEGVTCGQ